MSTKQDKINEAIQILSWQFADGDKIGLYTHKFHGAKLVSRHRTLSGAARAMASYKCAEGCTCGGLYPRTINND